MHADLLTKPLQGSLFKKFRDSIMNIQGDASVAPAVTLMHRSVLRKCTPARNHTHNSNVPERRSVLKVHWKRPICHIRLVQPINNYWWRKNLVTAAAGRAAEGKTFRTRD